VGLRAWFGILVWLKKNSGLGHRPPLNVCLLISWAPREGHVRRPTLCCCRIARCCGSNAGASHRPFKTALTHRSQEHSACGTRTDRCNTEFPLKPFRVCHSLKLNPNRDCGVPVLPCSAALDSRFQSADWFTRGTAPQAPHKLLTGQAAWGPRRFDPHTHTSGNNDDTMA
jgi:hypothetical protein